jgi:pimeloyl-ACP methyl ester carboxylesterase
MHFASVPKSSPSQYDAGMILRPKPGLVLVPGLLCDELMWRPQVSALAAVADCWVADHTRSETMADVAADVLRDAPFEEFALAGLSMGGYVVLEMMRQAAHRVLKLALLDTTARADTAEQTRKRRDFIALAERGRLLGITDVLLPLLIHPSQLANRELASTIKKMAKNTGRDAFIRQERAIISRSDSLPLLSRIACPTLVLCGRQDALIPLALHEEMASGIPESKLEIVEECGHLSTLERPVETSAALAHWLEP